MAFFGLTQYGMSDYFKYVKKPDYKEPDKSVPIEELHKKGLIKKTFLDITKDMEIPLTMNGYSYGSQKRLALQRKIGCIKPDGPNDIFRFPVTESMICGWWLFDDALKNETWMVRPKHVPRVYSSETSFLDNALKTDAFFFHSGSR